MTDSNIAGIAEADFGKAGVLFDNDRPILVDSSDFLFYAALAMLPIDGTVAGPYMPFWTPLSPWLFMAYAVANWRLLPQVWHRFRAFFLFPVLLIAVCSGLVSGSIPSASGAGVAGRRGWGSRLPVCVGHGITYQALVLAAHVGSADSRILVRLRSRCGAAVVNHV